MTNDHRINKPGVYRRRDGEHVYLWPTFSRGPLKWFAICSESPMSYKSNGAFWIGNEESSFDIVSYVSPIPVSVMGSIQDAFILAMRDSLAMEEQQPKPTYQQREKHACDVCGNVPDEEGFIQHGRGCYVVNEDGGGITLVDFEKESKQ